MGILRSVAGALALVMVAAACTPPPELSPADEELVSRCLELAFKQETSDECAQGATEPMREAFLAKHPDFYEQLVAERKKFVEDRIAEDVRRRDELNRCIEHRERGEQSSSCADFLPHEIERGLADRRLRRCAAARLDGAAEATQRCGGISEREIEDEVQMERGRRARSQ